MDTVSESAEGFLTAVPWEWGVLEGVWCAALVAGVYSGFWGYVVAPPWVHKGSERLPEGKFAKHVMDAYDKWCVQVNKGVTVLVTYHVMQWTWWRGVWAVEEFSVLQCVAHIALLFTIYEFFYYLFHRALHHKSVYALIHKHHHQQHSPYRGNTDAINTHPFEFLVGNYDHLLALHILSLVSPPHVITVLLFILIGGYTASLNHTRHHVEVSQHIFSASAHDVHHRVDVNSNYGQYLMIWDVVFGTYKRDPRLA